MSSQPPNTPLLRALIEYENLNRRRFHVPGHAGLDLLGATPVLPPNIYRYDQTEVEGLDVLSEPSECLLEAQQATAKTFGVAQSFFLVNGASAGLMAAMLACLQPGDQVLLPRNVHRSVMSGLIMTGAKPVWFLPEWFPEWGLWGQVSPTVVEQQLKEHPQVKALMLTSPTYEGLGSDIGAISQLCRDKGVLLIIDEAHGSLWPFSDELPVSSVSYSCDGVVHSLHKSAGSLTQSALFHLPYGSRLDPAQVQQALNLVQSTSPSYLLMASLDASQAFLGSAEGQNAITGLLAKTKQLRRDLHQRLQHFSLFQPDLTTFWDSTKLYLRSHVESGEDWSVRIESEQQLPYEATSPFGSLYLANLGLTQADYDYFLQVFQQADAAYSTEAITQYNCTFDPLPQPKLAMLPREAFFSPGSLVKTSQSVGRVVKDTIVHCPPGIPVLLPGEYIQEAHLPYLPENVSVVK